MNKLVLWISLIPILAISCSKNASMNSEEAILARTGIAKPSSDLNRYGLMGKVKYASTTEYKARLMFGEITPVDELEYDSVFFDESGYLIFEIEKNYEDRRESSTLNEYNSDHYVTKRTSIWKESDYSETRIETRRYDDYNNVIEAITPNYEGGLDTIKYAYVYDKYGRILQVETSTEKTTYQYNQFGFTTASETYVKDSLTKKIANTYFQDSLLLTSIEENSGRKYTTEVEYDSLGHKLKETKTGGITAGTTTYHSDGTRVWTTEKGDVYEMGPHYMKVRRPNASEYTPIEENHEDDQWGNSLKDESTYCYSGYFGPHYVYVTLSWEYQYDEHYNWIKKAQYSQTRGKEKELSKLVIRKIEYYE